jgi:hypothetical protein
VAALMSQFTHSINAPAAAAGAAAGFAQTPDLLPDLKGKGSKREREPEVDPKVINITVRQTTSSLAEAVRVCVFNVFNQLTMVLATQVLGQDGSAIDFKVRQTIQLGRVFEVRSTPICCCTSYLLSHGCEPIWGSN